MKRSSTIPVVAISLVAGYAASASAANRTTASIYHAFRADGTTSLRTRSKTGHCFSGSGTIGRRDAWRCISGNFLYDPCFSSPRATGIVLCPDAPWRNTAVKLRLTSPLPPGDPGGPSLRDQPWAIKLFDGDGFLFGEGASNVIHGQRLNYFRPGGAGPDGLWGFPARNREPWTILIAPFTATRLTRRAAIQHAWM